jgi:cardiolipin synthase (CMP-forming)
VGARGDCKHAGNRHRRVPPRQAASPGSSLTIPNLITIARLLGVPLIVWLMIADRFVEATILFIIAAISDAADGFIAKRFNATSELGAFLDPIADKALLVSVFVTLGFKGVLPAWLIILAVSRDLFIIGGLLLSYLLGNPMAVRPLWVSKANTAAQILLIALVLGERSGVAVFQPFLAAAVLATAALTVASAAAYLIEWARHMTGNG